VKVEVVRSTKRRKTVQARQVGDVLRISIPASMSKAEETTWVAEMVGRMQRKASTSSVDLSQRAGVLASRHGLQTPGSIRWVDNQEWRWGSCTPADGTIRVSSRLAREPLWVLDYVIVHELVHLSISGHNRAFWNLVYRYPRAERARGFLIARSWEPAEADSEPGADPEYDASATTPPPTRPLEVVPPLGHRPRLDMPQPTPPPPAEDGYPLVGTLF
jgi:predicted metal-dependent hydrolase